MKTLKYLFLIAIVVGLGYGAWFSVQASKCPDSDNDGLNDCDEVNIYHTDPYNPDTDHDGYKDGEEVKSGFSPLYGNRLRMDEVDSDHDGLNDAEEIKHHTNLNDPDTDHDGFNDFVEVQAGSNPLDSKSTPSASGNVVSKFFGE